MSFLTRPGAIAAACLFAAVHPAAVSTIRAQQPAAFRQGDITVTAPWVRQPPGGARVAGGFMQISNGGRESDRLIGGSAPFAKRFEVHEMAMDGGMMKMRELPKGLEIKPGAPVELKPGGYHIMFMDLTEAPTPGKPLKAKLRFEKAGELEVELSVTPMAAPATGAPKKTHQH